MAKLLKINGERVSSSHSKTIFTAVKKWGWIVLVLLMAGACLDEPDCLPTGDTALVISFNRLLDGKRDTVILYTIEAAGSDSIFYKTNPEKLDTIDTQTKPVIVAVNPYAEETLFTFFLRVQQKNLRVGYKNETTFISEECGSDRVQYDLSVLETDFDSVRVINSVLSKNRTVNIEIYR
ncbi:MAG: hypothetical protein IT367_21460 [Candidatus Hydrogenedentes bacterium]|nr:hypothetical protein [Candidatus Hydrogenedentota bacterium]